MVITQKYYAHLAPEAWERDYDRVTFVVPRDEVPCATTKRKPAKPSELAAPMLHAV